MKLATTTRLATPLRLICCVKRLEAAKERRPAICDVTASVKAVRYVPTGNVASAAPFS
jgi:hypothetical protein